MDKKKINLIKEEKKSSNISLIVDKFLDKYFADYKELFKWEASYNSRDGKVIISTGSKLIAGELSLRVKELAQLLREANLKVTQIIIA